MRVAVVASAQIFGGFQNLPPPQSLDFSAFFGLSHLFPPRLSISVIFDTDLVTSQRFRQLCQGNFLDIIFSCLYELHELTSNRFLSKLFFTLSDEQKEVLYYLFVKQYSTTRLAAIRGQSDRNIRKLRMTIQKKLQKRMYEHLSEKLENDHGLTLREREFMEEYEALLQTRGKDAVIRRENKTKPRKKKAALDDAKDG